MINRDNGVGTLGRSVKKPPPMPTPRQINDHLDSIVVGQHVAKRKLSVAVTSHYARVACAQGQIVDPKLAEVKIGKSNVLIIGPTGSGKTYLVKTIAAILKVPFVAADATTLTAAGYHGADVQTVLSSLLQAAGGDIKKAERGIVYIDEIDKLRKVPGNMDRDVGGECVQQALLTMIEGADHRELITDNRQWRHWVTAPKPVASLHGHHQHLVHLRRRICRHRDNHPQ